ncbi:hypothetical protein Goari_020929 [Gossypium aridum]|uniref:Uncharacterized protein n=1 Tax=Gossypium aridum TaxID=34290 RepID=A0A7J8YCU0_GOSAI|nr:hypothetical protein [Gossypium aridum]
MVFESDWTDWSGWELTEGSYELRELKDINLNEGDVITKLIDEISSISFSKRNNQVLDLGKCLGVTCDTFLFIIDKVKKRLSGWDSKLLSMARHVTLAKGFWRSTDGMQKPTLVTWDNYYQPIDCGNQCIKSILPFETRK